VPVRPAPWSVLPPHRVARYEERGRGDY
jgi:hypothetical protein